MNKTIYIRDEDTAVWDRAKELAGEKLAPVIVEGLKRFIAESERKGAEAAGFERIVLSFKDTKDNLVPKKKAFTGKWIFPPEAPFSQGNEDGTKSYCCAVATTPKGSAAVLYWEEDVDGGYHGKQLETFPSLNEAAASRRGKWGVLAAIEKLGVPVEELDI